MAFVHCNDFLKPHWYKNRSVWFYIREGLQSKWAVCGAFVREPEDACTISMCALEIAGCYPLIPACLILQATSEMMKIHP